jgi:hypothetical protein
MNRQAHYRIFCSEDINCPWLQPGDIGTPLDLGFSHSLQIKAWAEAHQ